MSDKTQWDSMLRGRGGPFTALEGERYVDVDVAKSVLRQALTARDAEIAELRRENDRMSEILDFLQDCPFDVNEWLD